MRLVKPEPEIYRLALERLGASKKKEDRDVVMTVFRNASINYPLFNDMDKELVLSYYNNENYITRFSLDTNWVKALAVVKQWKW